MKNLFFILIISLGIFLFGIDPFTITYECGGQNYHVYSGNPFIYKVNSLATSIAWTYYLKGMIFCWLFWVVIVSFLKYIIDKFIKDKTNRKLFWARRILILFSIIVSSLSLYIMISNSGNNLEWSADIEQEEETWGILCEPKFQIIN